MDNSVKIELARKLVSAFVIVMQAVFLLFPFINIQAQTNPSPFVGFEETPAVIYSNAGPVLIKLKTSGVMIHTPKLHLMQSGINEVDTVDSGIGMDGYHIYYYSLDPSPFKADTSLCLRALINNVYYPTDVISGDCSNDPYKIRIVYREYEPLAVSLVSPTSAANRFYLGSIVNLQARVTDASNANVTNSTVKYSVKQDGNEIGDFTGSSLANNYPYSWTPTAAGDYQVIARAINTSGEFFSAETAVSVIVSPGNNNISASSTASSTGLNTILTTQTLSENHFQFVAACNLDATVKFYVYQGANLKTALGTVAIDNHTFQTTWDATKEVAGKYTVKITADRAGYITDTKTVDINVADYKITNLEKPAAAISAPVTISFETNFKPTKAEVNIFGPKSATQIITPIQIADGKYKLGYYWPSSTFPAGSYTIKFIAFVNSHYAKEASISTNYIISRTTASATAVNTGSNSSLNNLAGDIEAVSKPSTVITPFSFLQKTNVVDPAVKDQIIQFQANQKADSVIIDLSGPVSYEGELVSDNGLDYLFHLQINNFDNGPYRLKAVAKKGSIVKTLYQNFTILKPKIVSIVQPAVSSAASTTSQSADNAETIFLECQERGILESGACREYLALETECRSRGLVSKQACDSYLQMNILCRQNDVTDPLVCQQFVLKTYTPNICKQAGQLAPLECSRYILNNNMPAVCRDADAGDTEACNKILAAKSEVPAKCLSAGYGNKEECILFLDKNILFPECEAAGISEIEACRKYIFEKLSDPGFTLSAQLMAACQKAGATENPSCRQLAQKIYMPSVCQEKGATEIKTCRTYLADTMVSPDCLMGGFSSRESCGQYLLGKYAVDECAQAGVTDGKACESFLFNRFAQAINCEGQDKWQCHVSAKDRYLGQILSKQLIFAELREKILPQASSVRSAKDIISQTSRLTSLLPASDGPGVKIIKTGEMIRLGSNDSLEQCGPIGLMIDSDQDGLPDDLEKRYGVDPTNQDTDGDSYTDGSEVAGNFNPLGLGKMEVQLAPIDEAIMKQKTISQPKAQGEITPALVVKQIASASGDTADKHLIISGSADPKTVITLFIYSDLPIIATVNVDETGDWNYELDQPLGDGEHEAYVALNDNGGGIIAKSKPLNFFIRDARAVSFNDYMASGITLPETKQRSMLNYYIIIALIAMIIGMLLFIIVYSINRNHGAADYHYRV